MHMGMDLKNLKSVLVIAEIGQNHQGDIEVAKNVMKSFLKTLLISD
jgi:sialic acid synthase SpsE